jgi:hypothetical protein
VLVGSSPSAPDTWWPWPWCCCSQKHCIVLRCFRSSTSPLITALQPSFTGSAVCTLCDVYLCVGVISCSTVRPPTHVCHQHHKPQSTTAANHTCHCCMCPALLRCQLLSCRLSGYVVLHAFASTCSMAVPLSSYATYAFAHMARGTAITRAIGTDLM